MRIRVDRTGGFAGLRRSATIDTNTLPPSESRRVKKLLADADFFHQPARSMPPKPVPDSFQYTVSVEDGERRHVVVVSEDRLTGTMRQLVDCLAKVIKKK